MSLRITIILAYLNLFFWIGMGLNLPRTLTFEDPLSYGPLFGFALAIWILVRLEFMSRQARKERQNKSTHATG